MKTLPEDLPNDVEALKSLLLEQAQLLGKKDSLLNEKDSQLAEWQSKYQLTSGTVAFSAAKAVWQKLRRLAKSR